MPKREPNILSLFDWPIAAVDRVPRGTVVGVLGVPSDRHSTAGGASEAPDTMRALPYYDQHGTFDLSAVKGVDFGNVDRWDDGALDEVAYLVEQLSSVPFLVVLGGDDTVSLPVCQERADQVIHFDAHTDMWEYPELRHGSWMRTFRSIRADVPVHQFGTRVGPEPQRDDLDPEKDTVLVVDIDVCDPSAAPGVVTPVPGGWTSGMLLANVAEVMAAHNVTALVVTEVNPVRDHNDMTSWLAQFVVVAAIEGFVKKLAKTGRRSR